MNRWTVAAMAALIATSLSCRPGGGTSDVVKAGDAVLDFELDDLDGNPVKTADLRAGKVLVLKFGTTRCGWCNKQIPHLNKVVETYIDKVAVIDVNSREEPQRVRAHNKKLGTKYTTLLDPQGSVATMYGVRGIPVVLIAGKDGKIVYRANYTKFPVLKKQIDDLLKDGK